MHSLTALLIAVVVVMLMVESKHQNFLSDLPDPSKDNLKLVGTHTTSGNKVYEYPKSAYPQLLNALTKTLSLPKSKFDVKPVHILHAGVRVNKNAAKEGLIGPLYPMVMVDSKGRILPSVLMNDKDVGTDVEILMNPPHRAPWYKEVHSLVKAEKYDDARKILDKQHITSFDFYWL